MFCFESSDKFRDFVFICKNPPLARTPSSTINQSKVSERTLRRESKQSLKHVTVNRKQFLEIFGN